MEHLIQWSPWFQSQYMRLLKRHRIYAASYGRDPFYSDAVPFWSRYKELAFLECLPEEDRHSAILYMSIRLWIDVEASLMVRNYRHPYMLFLYVDDWEAGEDDFPQPYLYFSGRDIQSLHNSFQLQPPHSQTARTVIEWIEGFGLSDVARVYESDRIPDTVRVLIDFTLPCSPNKIRLDSRLSEHAKS